MKNKGIKALPYILPSFIGLVVFALLPVIISFFISLTNWDGLTSLFSKNFFSEHYVGMDNFANIFTSGELYNVLGNTAFFIIMYIPLMLIVSLFIANLLNKKIKGKNIFRVIYYIPVLTSWVAASLVWRWFLSTQFGPVNEMISWLGIEGPNWLFDEGWMMFSIVMVSVWKDSGFYGLILLSGLHAIDQSYYEAAKVDGASNFHVFRKITLPLLTPSIFYVVLVSLIMSFQLFPQVVIMIKNVATTEAAQVMVERIYTYGFTYHEMGYASALSWVLFIIIFIFTLIQFKIQKRWVHYES